MFNVTVINVKKSLIRIIAIMSVIVIVFLATKVINKFETSEILQINLSSKLVKYLSYEIPAIESINNRANTFIKEDMEEEVEEDTLICRILSIELAKVHEKKESINNEVEYEANEEKTDITESMQSQTDIEVATNVNTEIVTNNVITESYNIEINGVKIKNETDFDINDSIMSQNLNINTNNIMIFHTHTCESYTPSDNFLYQQTGNYRTTDLNYTVSRVGDELTNYLIKSGFNVIHDKTYHDYPAYSGSYTRSAKTVTNLLQTNQSDIIIDLHRDAIGSKSDYDPSVKIDEDISAQLMFVIGTNGGGLYHPNWESNLKFAIEVQQKANELYPGLFKPIILRNSRYNQHLGTAACIIEVGATGNTLDQCLNSMKYLAKVLERIKNRM